jgi:glc operon protein GlcG
MSASNLLRYGLSLSLDEAKKVVDAAEREAAANDFQVIIAIADSAAQLVLLHRLDHAQHGSIDVAISKAQTAVRFKRPTKAVQDAISQGGLALRMLTIPNICGVEGGIPLVNDGKIVGAIGVSGMLPQQDSQVAEAGAAAYHNAMSR